MPSLPPSYPAFAAQVTALLAADQLHQGDTRPSVVTRPPFTSMRTILDRHVPSTESALSVLLSRLPPLLQQTPLPSPKTLQLSLPKYLFEGDPSTGLIPAVERCQWDDIKYRYKTDWYQDLRDLAAKDGMGDIGLDTIKIRISERNDT